MPSLVTTKANEILAALPDPKEIQNAVFSFSPDKAPRLDGFTGRFYQTYWHLIKRYLCQTIGYSLKISYIGGGINSAFLALIPKEQNPSSFSRFRPIFLCKLSYKITTKILALILKVLLPLLISPNQGSFVPGRQIYDTIQS